MASASSSPIRKRSSTCGFFPTVQLLLAGNDSQGLRYGTVTTREEFFVAWKAAPLPEGAPVPPGALLDRPLAELCDKARLLDLIRNFVIFDDGIKKVPRPHQFAGVKAAQERIRQARGRGHLAHPGQRQEHPDGAARQVAAGARPGGPHPRRHRPRRARQADRRRDEERRRDGRGLAHPAHHHAGGVRRQARGHRAAAAVRAGPQVRSGRPRTARRRRSTAVSTCSWTNATAPRAAT